jgi:hypothetical protein
VKQHVIQNCIDWNIKMRDSNRHSAMLQQHDIAAARELTRNVRRYQRNIDTLNTQLN